MRGLCTHETPEFGSLEIRFRDDLPENPDIDKEKLAPRAVVVHVLTAAVAVDDIHGAEGTYLTMFRSSPKKGVSSQNPYIPGFECCGMVKRAGEQAAKDFPIGTQVLCFQSTKNQRFGTWGEYFTFDPSKKSIDDPFIFKKPNHLTSEQAVATIAPGRVVCCTLSKQVYRSMSHSENPTMVIVGATGSIGSLTLKAARHEWPQANLVAVCSSANREFAKECGASEVLAYNEVPEWGAHEMVHGKTDVVLDLVGGYESLKQGRMALRRGGVFNTTVGPLQFIGDAGHIPIMAFAREVVIIACRLVGNLWRRSYKYYVRDMSAHCDMALYTRLQNEKVFIPHIDRIVKIKDEVKVREAIGDVRHHKCKGRVVFQVADESKAS